ncbi:golgin subfamily A member 6-like protein 22 [Bombyx mori]|uniref:Trichohyalin-plectin-homology domain-containing protein n=1 Tax=Bombyx mori TaxID=7091 RepID=A0A8R2M8S1_BOMMO|nr:golgin subfamily A member 6-like protein 22 isoform X1 [Bombyx mori]
MSRKRMEECEYCKERDRKIASYNDELEQEKIRECLKALEREKISNGKMSKKQDEIRLREMQKMQIEEKRNIEKEEYVMDMMWHQVLLDDTYRKEKYEKEYAERKQQEMKERRRAYDEQIASANSKRQQFMKEERHEEKEKIEKIKKKMEEDYNEEIVKKKKQQMTNKINFLEGHEMKLRRLHKEKLEDRQIDNNTIERALEDLRTERMMKMNQIRNLQVEKQICLQNYKNERNIASALDNEAERAAVEWKKQEEKKADEIYRRAEEENRIKRQKANQEYRQHLDELHSEMINCRREREEKMELVKRTALKEMQDKINDANTELRRQIEYRNDLTNHIRQNQKYLESNLKNMEYKDRPFTKKQIYFKDAMEIIGIPKETSSTNPVHPFKRVLQMKLKKSESVQLPKLLT